MPRTSPRSDPHFPPPERGADPDLDRVEDAIRSVDPGGDAFARVLRDTFDWLYDGQRTGRYAWSELRKTEKTHMGTLVEIELQREFDNFLDGDDLDYRIAGVEVDCKFTQSLGNWEIPVNIRRNSQVCLLVWADEAECRWEAGLVRARRDADAWFYSASPGNQDRKRRLSAAGESTVRWMWPGAALPPNQLLHLSEVERTRVLTARSADGRSSGQARVNELFRTLTDVVIRRATVETVAQQKDPMKRARDARLPKHLASEGILVLCGDWVSHRAAAATLGLPVPEDGEFVATRVAPAGELPGQPSIILGGRAWRLARPGEPRTPVPPLAP